MNLINDEIEDKISILGSRIIAIERLVKVIELSFECLDNITISDTHNLTLILSREIDSLHKNFSEIDDMLVKAKSIQFQNL